MTSTSPSSRYYIGIGTSGPPPLPRQLDENTVRMAVFLVMGLGLLLFLLMLLKTVFYAFIGLALLVLVCILVSVFCSPAQQENMD